MVTNNNEKMQELTVEEKLQNLYELQRIDTEIDKIKTLRGELPLEVQDLEDEIAGLETRIENLKVELGELDKTSSTRKMDIKKAEEAIKKYSEQLDNVRNNREYDALSKEIEFQKLEIELQEKRIREAQKAKAEKDSELNIVLINLMNTKSNNFLAIENDFEENAKINYTIIDFGGKNSITNYYSNLKGNNCDNQLNTIYLGKENQLFDLNYIGELRGKKSNIDIEVQGALKDVAKKHFKGTIDFKKGCKKATGNENEACMLLSDTAKSIALPMLLCSEEEVEGNHSSSAGKIGEKELFYIMSRGFELKEAMKLMVRARFNKILENIKNEELKDEILKEIDMRLD